MKTFFTASILASYIFCLCHAQKVPPGVNPQQYQQYQDPQYHHQQYQVPSQQIHINQNQQYAPPQQQQQQVPVQQQQVPVQQQQVPVQQQQVPVQQQQVPVQQQQQQHGHHQQQQQHGQQHQQHGQQQAHQGGHHAHGGQKVFNAANIQQEKEHIAEHMEVPIDTSKMSEQELQFHYFKMHDADNNNKLDGCELIKSLIHWHDKNEKEQVKIYSDEELANSIDPIITQVDKNNDGFVEYSEFKLLDV